MKDEICDDLDDFVSEVDHNENVEIPQHMDQVVDIVVNNEREKADKIDAAASEFGEESMQFREAMEEIEPADEKPPSSLKWSGESFWSAYGSQGRFS